MDDALTPEERSLLSACDAVLAVMGRDRSERGWAMSPWHHFAQEHLPPEYGPFSFDQIAAATKLLNRLGVIAYPDDFVFADPAPDPVFDEDAPGERRARDLSHYWARILTPSGPCPNCSSDRIARIVWGLPMFGDRALIDAVHAGRAILGGCIVTPSSPLWKCHACRHRWGRRSDTLD